MVCPILQSTDPTTERGVQVAVSGVSNSTAERRTNCKHVDIVQEFVTTVPASKYIQVAIIYTAGMGTPRLGRISQNGRLRPRRGRLPISIHE